MSFFTIITCNNDLIPVVIILNNKEIITVITYNNDVITDAIIRNNEVTMRAAATSLRADAHRPSPASSPTYSRFRPPPRTVQVPDTARPEIQVGEKIASAG